jgi:hypothetical protein
VAQHDYVIANGTGAAVRSDLNNGLAAIVSNNSGATEPATMYAYQWWADTTTGLLKLRNAANSAWVTVGTLASANLGLAALASPTFTGTVTAPTFTASTAVNIPLGSAGSPTLFFTGDTNNGLFSPGADIVALTTDGSERFRIAASGQIGLGGANYGTSGQALTSNGSGSAPTWQTPVSTSDKISEGDTEAEVVDTGSDGHFKVTTEGSERLRVDPSGRLLVGTSTAVGGDLLQIRQDSGAGQVGIYRSTADIGGPFIFLYKSRGTAGSPAVVQDGDITGTLLFQGYSGAAAAYVISASIAAQIDGTPDSGGDTTDMPGRLVFSTTADGASSPTERMRITNGGNILLNKTTVDNTSDGIATFPFATGSYLSVVSTDSSGATRALLVNRQSSDGPLVEFFQAITLEGAISVSGTTVTYGGGHLARWSQLLNAEDPSTLLKGTVMSNLDEMCEWGEEDNEQLNKTKVSDVEGDPNVAGVFVSTSPSDDGPLDYFCAMTGDMIIRIAEGVTVQRGDLLMSAGDGTVKPQDDDIIRSKTIAKVTSTHVTCTYDDGSYCVPCVLMAC